MKIKFGQLRRLIIEIAGAGDIPAQGDIFVYPEEPEYGGEELGKDRIDDAGDLSTATHNDISSDVGDGPAVGEEGVWIWCHDMAWTFSPGELVRTPEYDEGTFKAWAKKKNLKKLSELSVEVSPVDAKILKLLGKVTTYGTPSLNAVKAFSIRPRKDSIYFHYDESGGIEGKIDQVDIRQQKISMTISDLAAWMLAHGARKIKPQKRRTMMPYYD